MTYDALLDTVRRLLIAGGCEANEAGCVAEEIAWSEMAGLPQQGVWRLGKYLTKLLRGGYAVGIAIEVRRVGPSLSCVDGKNGLGPYVARVATDHAIALASDSGIGVASVRNSNHFGAAGYFVGRIAAKGHIGLVFTNTPPRVSSPESSEAVVGNSVFAFAAPTNTDPIVVDMCAGAASGGSIVRAAELAKGCAMQSSAQALDVHTAAISPFGGHKGFAMGIALDLLCGALSGGGVFDDVKSQYAHPDLPSNVSHFIMAIDPSRTSGRQRFDEITTHFLSTFIENGLHVPGQARFRMSVEKRDHAFDLEPDSLLALQQWTTRLGIDLNPRLSDGA